jgi:ketol-acid reductoisomerase
MKLYTEADVDSGALRGEKIAVLGYGSQGRAHAMNLRDSGYDVVIGVRPDGKTTPKAQRDGFTVKAPVEAVKGCGLVAFLASHAVRCHDIPTPRCPPLRTRSLTCFTVGRTTFSYLLI